MTENAAGTGNAARTTFGRVIAAIVAGSVVAALAVTAVDEVVIAAGLNPQPAALGPINWPLATLADLLARLMIFLVVSFLLGAPAWWALHRFGYRKPVHGAIVGSILALLIAAPVQMWLLTHSSLVLDRAGRILAASRSPTWAGAVIVLRRSLIASAFGALAGFTTFKIGYTQPAQPPDRGLV